jgi:5'-3' exonuclease
MLQKYKRLRHTQSERDKKADAEQDQEEGLHSIISDIREEFFSDLNPEEIPNSDISDISESEIVQDGDALIKMLEEENTKDTKIDLIKAKSETAIEKNHNFMKEFVNTYKEDSNAAKRNYYKSKLKFDLTEPKGKGDLRKLLYRYLEGL